MNPHYLSKTESSSQKTMPPVKLKERLEALEDDVETIKQDLEKQASSIQTIEKHNAVILRQFDQLRGLFEKFYEEMSGKILRSERTLEDKITEIEISSQTKIAKLEKLADLNEKFKDKTTKNLDQLDV